MPPPPASQVVAGLTTTYSPTPGFSSCRDSVTVIVYSGSECQLVSGLVEDYVSVTRSDQGWAALSLNPQVKRIGLTPWPNPVAPESVLRKPVVDQTIETPDQVASPDPVQAAKSRWKARALKEARYFDALVQKSTTNDGLPMPFALLDAEDE
jgi:hypothetical protein